MTGVDDIVQGVRKLSVRGLAVVRASAAVNVSWPAAPRAFQAGAAAGPESVAIRWARAVAVSSRGSRSGVDVGEVLARAPVNSRTKWAPSPIATTRGSPTISRGACRSWNGDPRGVSAPTGSRTAQPVSGQHRLFTTSSGVDESGCGCGQHRPWIQRPAQSRDCIEDHDRGSTVK